MCINLNSLLKKKIEKIKKIVNLKKKEIKKNYNVTNFKESQEKLKEAYNVLNNSKHETVTELFDLALKGELDIKNYLLNSKTKQEIYNSFIIEEIDKNNKVELKKFNYDLSKIYIEIGKE